MEAVKLGSMTQQAPGPFIRFLARAVKSVHIAGLPRDPRQPARDGAKAPERDWEPFGHDLGRAVRKFKDGAGLRDDRPWTRQARSEAKSTSLRGEFECLAQAGDTRRRTRRQSGPDAQQVGLLCADWARLLATLVSVIVAVVLPGNAAQAQIQSNEVKTLLRHERILDGICRGRIPDSPHAHDKRAATCCGRTLMNVRLNQLGWCFGKRGQTGADQRWHRCSRESHRNHPSNYCS